jgi:hypothetical protein
MVHRWLLGTVPPPALWQRIADFAIAFVLIAVAFTLAFMIGATRAAILPVLLGCVIALCAVGTLRLAYRLAATNAVAAAAVLAVFSTADLAWNNGPNESTGLPPTFYDALRPDTKNETVALLRAKLAETAAPDRRDRVELIGIGYHWPNVGLVHGFDHLFGHNPLRLREFAEATRVADTVAVPDQRPFSPLLPSYNSPLENMFGVRFIATGVPVEEIDKSLKPGDLPLVARTRDAYVYENPFALPRVMLAGEWKLTNFGELLRTGQWPDFDPRRSVLLERAPRPAFPPSTAEVGTARIVSYRNDEVVVEIDATSNAVLVLNDIWHPWWRATLDGKPVEIQKANLLFRGVAVPPGKHTVRFTFHPVGGALAQFWETVSARLR